VLFISRINKRTRPLLDYTFHWAVKKNLPLLYLSLETDSRVLINRLIEESAGIREGKVQEGMLSPEEFHNFRQGTEMVAQAPLFFQEKAPVELFEIESILVNAKAESGIEVVVVDYLALVKVDGVAASEQKLEKVCGELSRLSKVHKVTIVGTILEPRSGKIENEDALTSIADEVIDCRYDNS